MGMRFDVWYNKPMSLVVFLRSCLAKRQNGHTGFSLVEMMVVLTIFAIMTAVVMANFPAFQDKTALQLIAQEIATTIRQAQVYGIGTRVETDNFPSHGVYFDLTTSDGNKSFVLYADKNNAQPGFGDEDQNSVIEKFTIRGAVKINALCKTDCSSETLDILFQRPYPEANFIGGTYGGVKVEIQSTRDPTNKRLIEVSNTGQISVKNPTP